MFKNYFKIAWRNLKRNKGYAAINVLGLSLGIASSILIFTLVSFHFSFDDFHKNRDRIYRVVTEIHNEEISHTPGVPPPFAKAFRNDFTFSEKTARAVAFGGELVSIPGEGVNKKFQEDNGIACVEPSFFDIFNFPLVQGDIRTALSEPFTALITQKLAKKYFGTGDPIGKIIRVDNKTDFKITGILKDLPLNTDRKQEIYVSDKSMKSLSGFQANETAWGGISSEAQCFVLLKPGVTGQIVEKAFPGFIKKYYPNNPVSQNGYHFKMQPLSDIHFNPDYSGYAEKKYLWALSLVGVFLVITACVNFINLATAQTLKRAREVGIRKALGSMRYQLFWQFIAETALISFFALLVAYGLAALGLPYLNGLFKTDLGINPFIHTGLFLFLILVTLAVIFFSGAYPGLILSGFQPVAALKGTLSRNSSESMPLRRILVIAQFAISQILIIGTIVIAGQMNFSKQSDLGFRKDAIVMLPIPENDSAGLTKMQSFGNRLKEIPGVGNISFCMQAPASEDNNTTNMRFDNRAKDELWEVNTKSADAGFASTFDLKIIAGRNIFKSDTLKEYLVNETLVRKLNLHSPQEILNKNMKINGKTARVVGVVKDFYNYSFRTDIAAIAIYSSFNDYQNCAVKVNMSNLKQTLAGMEKIWNDTYPQYVYSSQFLDERIASFYELDDIMLRLIEVFAGIAIFIGCLGLYGLVSFMAVQKTKEIGVRKVLGAGLPGILWLFGKEFTRLLLIAFVIAAPIAWWAMSKYLQDFKYRIPLGAGIFVLAILSTFLVAALTVGYKSMRAALANPVKSLKTE